MIPFQYARARDVADAVRQVGADRSARFIAGGTNLLDLMKDHVERPSRLIDISRLPLKSVEETAAGGLRIGALVPNSDLAYHPLVERRYPMLASAILAGANTLLHAGTLDADAAPVHEAHLVQPGVCGRLDVRGHDIGDVARRERVEIELGSDRHDVSHRTNGRTAYGSGLKEHCGLRLKAQGSESTAA